MGNLGLKKSLSCRVHFQPYQKHLNKLINKFKKLDDASILFINESIKKTKHFCGHTNLRRALNHLVGEGLGGEVMVLNSSNISTSHPAVHQELQDLAVLNTQTEKKNYLKGTIS